MSMSLNGLMTAASQAPEVPLARRLLSPHAWTFGTDETNQRCPATTIEGPGAVIGRADDGAVRQSAYAVEGGNRRQLCDVLLARIVRASRDAFVDVLDATAFTSMTTSSSPGTGSGKSS